MIEIQAKEKKCIDLGRRGEDCARTILFDITGYAELYGQGEARLVAKRYKDMTSYAVPITQDNTTVKWVVRAVDNNHPGYGECELVYITDGAVVKSTTYQTFTEMSLSDPVGEPDTPSTFGAVIEEVKEVLAEFERNNTTTDEEIIEVLIEQDFMPVVTDSDSSILADENGNILLW